MNPPESNLHTGNELTDFWVWINPLNWLVKHQIKVTGCFFSAGSVERGKSNLPFLPNPHFSGDISPFTVGVTHEFTAEYNLEINREHYFPQMPSRLNSIYLLQSEEEANEYKRLHMGHVSDRILKRVHSVGPHVYSTHDSGWVDFLRHQSYFEDDTIHQVAQAYWKGVKVESCDLKSHGKSWTQPPTTEVLYLGRVDFYDRSLP